VYFSHDGNNLTAHRMFLHLCSLIGVDLQTGALCERVEEARVQELLSRLLREVQTCELYSVAEDNAALTSPQLQSYRRLLDLLLPTAR
jgi:hypothetical protein